MKRKSLLRQAFDIKAPERGDGVALSPEEARHWLAYFQRQINSRQVAAVLKKNPSNINNNAGPIIKKLFSQGYITEVKK